MFLYTTLFQKHLQYRPIDSANILIAATRVPVVENIFTFIGDQKLWGYVLSFVIIYVKILYMFHFWNFVS